MSSLSRQLKGNLNVVSVCLTSQCILEACFQKTVHCVCVGVYIFICNIYICVYYIYSCDKRNLKN